MREEHFEKKCVYNMKADNEFIKIAVISSRVMLYIVSAVSHGKTTISQ